MSVGTSFPWMPCSQKRSCYRRHLLRGFATLAGLLVTLGGAVFPPLSAESAELANRPNIVFILADDLGSADLACYGNRDVPTPRLDRMAAEGTRFTQYYCGSPICSPSRTSLTTGMYPGRWRITSFLQTKKGNRDCGQADFLDPAAPSLARILKSAGYKTAHIGKWHMGGGRDVDDAPKFAAYGFDEHAGTWESPEPHADITATDWIWSEKDKVKRHDRTAFFVDRTLDFLKRHKGQPCYVNLWPDDVHTPWVPSDEQLGPQAASVPEQQRKYRAVLAELDRQVGRLLDGIKEMGLDDHTLVLFTSDNGALPTFGGKRSVNFRGSKLSLYEGGIRMPFIAHWPGRVPAGRTDAETVLSAVDLFPSLCKLAGAPLPAAALDGEELSGALLGQSFQRRQPLMWEYGRNATSFAYPQGRDKSPNLAVRDGRWKLLVNADGSGAELYDLSSDAGEAKNVAEQQPEIVKRLREVVLAWRKSLP